MTNRILVTSEHASFRVLEKNAASIVRRVLRYLRNENCAVELFLVTNETMRGYNRKFRGKDAPTTILSFDVKSHFPRPDLNGRRYLGELFIAPRYVVSEGQNLEFLIIHGLLHLMGYTHKGERARIHMERRERVLCRALGKG